MVQLTPIEAYVLVASIILTGAIIYDYLKSRPSKKIKDDYKKSEPIDFNKKGK
jgi:hypothetical protein